MARGHAQGLGLLGRRSEREALGRLLDAVQAGQSAVLVLRGEAGCGKTALLDHLATSATGCRIARAAGVESEMELPFAGLHQLCAPMLDAIGRLPAPQRNALSVAFGLSDGGPPDRFLVALAALTLLSEMAGDRPLVCVFDDAHWLDRASAESLAFVARRLMADPVALVFAVREPSDEPALSGLPALTVKGLSDADARVLLHTVVPVPLDERVLDRIIAETRGNPLALLELPRDTTPAELAGGYGLVDAGPVASRIEQSFATRLGALPEATRVLLLAAAAEPLGDGALLWRAAARLGIEPGAAEPAERAGLVELGATVRFRHPLVRSAAYHAADSTERHAVHRALAEATDRQADPDRRVWHLARATVAPDEAVAFELERSAGRAQSRGGLAAAAAFQQRAAELTPDPARRGARALEAALAKLDAAAPDAATELVAIAGNCPLSELDRARLGRLRAQIAFVRTRGSDAPRLLLDAAKSLEPLDTVMARETFLEALGAAILAGRLGRGCGVRDVAEAVRASRPASEPTRASDLLLDGLATRFTDGHAAGVAPLRRALDAFRRQDGGDDSRWLWLACRVAPALWDDEAWDELTTRQVRIAHDSGALSAIPLADTYRAGVCVHTGEFDEAAALIDEADAITEATGGSRLAYTALVLAAWRGLEPEALELIGDSIRDATARGEGRAVSLAEYSRAVLCNGLGRYDDALAAAQLACEPDELGVAGWALIELVEAAVRSGAPEVAADALRRLEERTRAAGTDWALGTEARLRALLSEGAVADAAFRDSIERLGRTRIAIHLARTHLLYGEWLRRERRRVDARAQLRRAHDMFSRFGALAFAERARRELLATGATPRKRTADTLDELTAQERLIARLAGEGRTNPEIGAELFISPRTVEYHLGKVFAKLGVSSRWDLRDALAGTGTAVPA
jgi:DNA-binding CsgD family transcriptional regulator